MEISTTASKIDTSGANVRLDQAPDVCPRCHRSVHPKLASAHIVSDLQTCQAIFRCTHLKCQEIFIGTYSAHGEAGGRKNFKLTRVSPRNAMKSTFPQAIQDVSPTFCEIFNQTEEANALNLDQLVGIGLRKGLEFLVKDYACSEHPESETKIRAAPLSVCINDYVDDTNVRECAKRASWLGNDETHYTRKWETKDVSDLKLLVRLTVNWIESSLLTKKYISEM